MSKTLNAMLAAHPDKIDAVSDESGSGDGYWIYLKDGWCYEGDVHSVHEWTIRDLRRAWTSVQPCVCEDCTKALAGEGRG